MLETSGKVLQLFDTQYCFIHIDTVRRGTIEAPPAAETEDAVKVWFRNAGDRAGGHKQRDQRGLAAQE